MIKGKCADFPEPATGNERDILGAEDDLALSSPGAFDPMPNGYEHGLDIVGTEISGERKVVSDWNIKSY